MKILYVDDDKVALRTMQRVVDSLGYSFLGVESAAEGLEVISEQPDLVFVDWRLPDMNGLTLAECIHEQLPVVPIIAITGIDLSGEHERWLDAGCVELLTKPVEISTLIDILKSFAGRRLTELEQGE